MAHFAQIDENNLVVQVLVIPNEEEYRGQEYLADELGLGGTWIQTSYNHNIRKKFAGIGDTYDLTRDAFISPKNNCHTEETFNEESCVWTCTNAEHKLPEPAIE